MQNAFDELGESDGLRAVLDKAPKPCLDDGKVTIKTSKGSTSVPVAVTAGHDSFALLTADNKGTMQKTYRVCGRNESGQLGLASATTENTDDKTRWNVVSRKIEFALFP